MTPKPKLLSVCFKSAKEALGWANSFYGSYNQQDIPTITHLSSKPAVWRLNIPESVQELGYTFFTAEGRYPLKAVGFNHEIVAQRDGLTFGSLTAETAERIGFDAAPPSLADDVQAIRALLADAPPETPDTTPEALRYGADSTEAADLADALSRVLALLKEVTLKSAEVRTAIGIASDALRIKRSSAALPSETTEDK